MQKKKVPASIATKIRRLTKIAEELKSGYDFSITRLTTIKSLCNDQEPAEQFAFHLAKLTYTKMQEKTDPEHIDSEKWLMYKRLVEQAISQMEDHLDNPTNKSLSLLGKLHSELKGLQNQHERQEWGPVRIVESNDALLVEMALDCLLASYGFSNWGYRIARQYAERYNSHYGTGLLPESAPMMEDIANFWHKYHYGVEKEQKRSFGKGE